VNQLEDSNQTDLTGFPPDLSAPIRPAIPRRTASPLSLSSPLIDVDDDLDELDLDELDSDELGDDDGRVASLGDGTASTTRRNGTVTFGDRARRLGAQLAHKVLVPVAAIAILVVAMGGTWTTAGATPTTFAAAQPGAHAAAGASEPEHATHSKAGHHELSGKLNLNTASEDQLMVLPSVGPAKAERIVTWRKKNGGFKRTADLRHVKGFGYKTFKKLEPYLDIKGDTTLAPK
jgi:competence protein ComEA